MAWQVEDAGGERWPQRNVLYERLNWPEIRDAAAADKVILLPFASIEQHGSHLPVDVDLRLAREVCLRAAARNANASS